MLAWIKNYLLEQEIKRNPKVTRQFTEWEKVRSAIILTDSSRYDVVKGFVRQSGKNFDIVVFYNDKTSQGKDGFLSVNKKDFAISGIPKPEVIQKIKAKPYDVLIAFDYDNREQMKALCALIQAKCKVGPEAADYKKYFDISIQSNEAEFLKQALKYLMMIKS